MSVLGRITLTVVKADLTHDICTFSTMDPQFKAYLKGSNNVYLSAVKMNAGKYPKWDESLNLEYRGETTLIIEIFHEKELVGRAEIPTMEIISRVNYAPEWALYNGSSPRGQVFTKLAYVSGQTNINTGNNFNNQMGQNTNMGINNNFNQMGSNTTSTNNNFNQMNTNTTGTYNYNQMNTTGTTNNYNQMGTNTKTTNTNTNTNLNNNYNNNFNQNNFNTGNITNVPITTTTTDTNQTNYNKDLIIPKINLENNKQQNNLYSFNNTNLNTNTNPQNIYGLNTNTVPYSGDNVYHNTGNSMNTGINSGMYPNVNNSNSVNNSLYPNNISNNIYSNNNNINPLLNNNINTNAPYSNSLINNISNTGYNNVNDSLSMGNNSNSLYSNNLITNNLNTGSNVYTGNNLNTNNLNTGNNFNTNNQGFSGFNDINNNFNYNNQNVNTNFNNNVNTNFNNNFNNNNNLISVNTSNTNNKSNLTSNYTNQNNLNSYDQNLNYNKTLLFFQHNSRLIFSFDFVNRTWKTVNNNSQEYFNQYHRATELPDGSYFITGGEYNNQNTNSVSHFLNGYFVQKEKMTYPRKAHTAVHFNGFVFVFGGFGNSGILKNCEKYDLTKGGWTDVASLSLARAYATPVPYGNNFIFLVGGFKGEKSDGSLEMNVIERYDVIQNKFDLFNIRLPSPVYGCIATFVSDNKILIAGGYSEEKGSSSKVFTINMSNGNVDYLPELNQPNWSVLSPFYQNGVFNIFSIGEETDATPTHHSYILKTPLY